MSVLVAADVRTSVQARFRATRLARIVSIPTLGAAVWLILVAEWKLKILGLLLVGAAMLWSPITRVKAPYLSGRTNAVVIWIRRFGISKRDAFKQQQFVETLVMNSFDARLMTLADSSVRTDSESRLYMTWWANLLILVLLLGLSIWQTTPKQSRWEAFTAHFPMVAAVYLLLLGSRLWVAKPARILPISKTQLREALWSARHGRLSFNNLVFQAPLQGPLWKDVVLAAMPVVDAVIVFESNIVPSTESPSSDSSGKGLEWELDQIRQSLGFRKVVIVRDLTSFPFAHLTKFAEARSVPYNPRGIKQRLFSDPNPGDVMEVCMAVRESRSSSNLSEVSPEPVWADPTASSIRWHRVRVALGLLGALPVSLAFAFLGSFVLQLFAVDPLARLAPGGEILSPYKLGGYWLLFSPVFFAIGATLSIIYCFAPTHLFFRRTFGSYLLNFYCASITCPFLIEDGIYSLTLAIVQLMCGFCSHFFLMDVRRSYWPSRTGRTVRAITILLIGTFAIFLPLGYAALFVLAYLRLVPEITQSYALTRRMPAVAVLCGACFSAYDRLQERKHESISRGSA